MAGINNNKNDLSFSSDLEHDGFHVLDKKKAKIPGFYPNQFPEFKDLSLKDLKADCRITIRVFVLVSTEPHLKVDSGLIDLDIEAIEDGVIWGNIITELPSSFPLSKGTTIELKIDEILYQSSFPTRH